MPKDPQRPYKYAQAYDYPGELPLAAPAPEPEVNRDAERVIPVCEPDLRGREGDYASEAVQSGWISSKGHFVQRFEEQFSSWVGAKYGCAVNSGTSALHLCMAALGLGPGYKVIVPTFTMVATANAPMYVGARPVLADVDRSYCLCPLETTVLAQSVDNIGAIIPVHVYGQPCQISHIERLAAGRGIPVIYDSAEAHGTKYGNRPLGEYGLANCYSFFGNKTLTTGEGGMVVSNDEEFIEVCRNLRDMSFSQERHFWHRRLGYNFRMTNVQAAIGCGQVERADVLVALRQENLQHYMDGLQEVPGIGFQPPQIAGEGSAWMCGIEVRAADYGITRCALRKRLAARGIETRTYFVPIHMQPYYWHRVPHSREFPHAERLAATGLYLPSASTLTQEDREYVINAIKQNCVQ